MRIFQCLLFGLQTKIILSFSSCHLLFLKNRFSLAGVLTVKSQYSCGFAFFAVNKGAYGLANVQVNHVVTDSASVGVITNALSISLQKSGT